MRTSHCLLLLAAVAAIVIPLVGKSEDSSEPVKVIRRLVMPLEGVPTTGSVADSWTKPNPEFPCYSSVAEAVRNAVANDVIVLAPGTHEVPETIHIDKESLHIRNCRWSNVYLQVPRESVVLKGSGSVPIMMVTMKSVKISDLTFVNGYTNAVDGASAICFPNSKSGFAISNCVFTGNNSAGSCVKVNQSARLKIMDCVFSNNVQTASSGISHGVALDITTSTWEQESSYGTIWNCSFKDNTASAPQVQGGVVYVSKGCVRMENCSFVSNTVSQTGTSPLSGNMLCIKGSNATIANCYFTGVIPAEKDHYTYGSAIYLQSEGCVVSNCTFAAIEEKKPIQKGIFGIIYTKGLSTKVLDCSFVGNTIYTDAIFYVHNTGDALVRNCLFAKNVCDKNRNSRMIRLSMQAPPSPLPATGITVENCTFADNTDDLSMLQITDAGYANYLVNSVFTTDKILPSSASLLLSKSSLLASNCCFTAFQEIDGLSFNDKCITLATVDAMKFMDPANGDYHLDPLSPLRGKGVELDWMTAGAKDLDGNRRVVSRYGASLAADASALPDIGCYECQKSIPRFIISVR